MLGCNIFCAHKYRIDYVIFQFDFLFDLKDSSYKPLKKRYCNLLWVTNFVLPTSFFGLSIVQQNHNKIRIYFYFRIEFFFFFVQPSTLISHNKLGHLIFIIFYDIECKLKRTKHLKQTKKNSNPLLRSKYHEQIKMNKKFQSHFFAHPPITSPTGH